jgi:carboxypeptidase Q
MEAARLLMAAGAKPERTIRFILWDGEEQGLLGSAAYVKQLQEAGTLDTIVACFVDDGGTNYQGGLPAMAEQRDLLAAATAPVNGQFFDTVSNKPLNVDITVSDSLGSVGGSDHASFNRVGVPGFYWREVGRADYGYGWHTQNDTLALAIPEYLMQSATCSAVTAYNLACTPEKFPRIVQKEGAEGSQERPRRNRGQQNSGS